MVAHIHCDRCKIGLGGQHYVVKWVLCQPPTATLRRVAIDNERVLELCGSCFKKLSEILLSREE